MALTEGGKNFINYRSHRQPGPDSNLFFQMSVVMLELIFNMTAGEGGAKRTVNALNHPDERRLLVKGEVFVISRQHLPTQP